MQIRRALLEDLWAYQTLAGVDPLRILKEVHLDPTHELDLQEFPALSSVVVEEGGLDRLRRHVSCELQVTTDTADELIRASLNSLAGFTYADFAERRLDELDEIEAELERIQPSLPEYTLQLLALGRCLTVDAGSSPAYQEAWGRRGGQVRG